MYALPSRQRRRNNYSRTILADRSNDMLPHLSTKQLFSVKEILVGAGFVNRVVTRPVTLREILLHPAPNSTPEDPVFRFPLYQPGLRLIRTVVRILQGDTDHPRSVSCFLSSEPGGSGLSLAETNHFVSITADIRWPTPVDPYLIFQVPLNTGTLTQPSQFKSQFINPQYLGYYPNIDLWFTELPEPTDDVILTLYYLN